MSIQRVVCLNCMDGRTQLPVINWIKKTHEVIDVDMVTEPGVDGMISSAEVLPDSLKKKIDIAIDKNSAAIIFIAGHYDCKGNPVSDDEHKAQIKASAEKIKDVYTDMPVVGIWVNDKWGCETVT